MKSSLGRWESEFLARVGPQSIFDLKEARKILGSNRERHVLQFLARLKEKGWIERIKPGLYAVIPLSSGSERAPQLHEFVIAMKLVEPAAIAFLSALNHYGLTEQIPRQVFLATNHRVARLTRISLGFSYRIICQSPLRFFGLQKEWVDERSFQITDLEKTLIDSLTLPQYAGGMGIVAPALAAAWPGIDEAKLHAYAVRTGVSAVAKRLGFLMEQQSLGNPEKLRKAAHMSEAYSLLDPTLPARGPYNRSWRLRVNLEVRP
ncbi:MAG: type IV toxin-antitoxin system AbiEi family antitoxin domain-containing protein [Candidatus Aminicenantes bacterium]|nr:type IV toxin-antitoxin system AbiEi family antitoxin domain-containing protein [Candidatus Aminicenantes bacterium]